MRNGVLSHITKLPQNNVTRGNPRAIDMRRWRDEAVRHKSPTPE